MAREHFRQGVVIQCREMGLNGLPAGSGIHIYGAQLAFCQANFSSFGGLQISRAVGGLLEILVYPIVTSGISPTSNYPVLLFYRYSQLGMGGGPVFQLGNTAAFSASIKFNPIHHFQDGQ